MTAVADIAWSDVTAIAPELTSVLTPKQNFILSLVKSTVEEGAYLSQDIAFAAACFLGAHYGVTFSSLVGSAIGYSTGGQVASVRVGEVSQTFVPPMQGSGAFSNFMRTTYGRQYIELMQSNVLTVAVV